MKCYEERCEDIKAVILDLTMPEMDGIEAARSMRNHEKTVNRPRVPIVCLTGHDDPAVVKECTEAGIDAVVAKPIQKQRLLG